MEIVHTLEMQGGFRSLTENIDTTSASGRRPKLSWADVRTEHGMPCPYT